METQTRNTLEYSKLCNNFLKLGNCLVIIKKILLVTLISKIIVNIYHQSIALVVELALINSPQMIKVVHKWPKVLFTLWLGNLWIQSKYKWMTSQYSSPKINPPLTNALSVLQIIHSHYQTYKIPFSLSLSQNSLTWIKYSRT
jgi:hypothetical protein